MIWHEIWYHMIYDSNIWYQKWYDIWYISGGFRGVCTSSPLGQYIHLKKKSRWPPQTYLDQSRTPPNCPNPGSASVWYDMACLLIVLKYLILQQQLWQCYNFFNLPSSTGLHAVMCCNCFPMLTTICNTQTLHCISMQDLSSIRGKPPPPFHFE